MQLALPECQCRGRLSANGWGFRHRCWKERKQFIDRFREKFTKSAALSRYSRGWMFIFPFQERIKFRYTIFRVFLSRLDFISVKKSNNTWLIPRTHLTFHGKNGTKRGEHYNESPSLDCITSFPMRLPWWCPSYRLLKRSSSFHNQTSTDHQSNCTKQLHRRNSCIFPWHIAAISRIFAEQRSILRLLHQTHAIELLVFRIEPMGHRNVHAHAECNEIRRLIVVIPNENEIMQETEFISSKMHYRGGHAQEEIQSQIMRGNRRFHFETGNLVGERFFDRSNYGNSITYVFVQVILCRVILRRAPQRSMIRNKPRKVMRLECD